MSHNANQRAKRLYTIMSGNQELTSLVCSPARVRMLVKRYRATLHANVRAIPC